jgi:ankyrin repeat protein
MKHLLLTTIVAVVVVGTAFADPIHDAAKNGNLVSVQAELDKGVDVDAKDEDSGWTPLLEAASEGHKAIVELLIEEGADIEAKSHWGATPLHHAADGGSTTETVELLIAKGADVNAKAGGGTTPLHWVFDGYWVQYVGFAGCGEPDQIIKVVELLVSNGAEVNAKAGDGETPMDYAYESDCNLPPDLDFLRKHGAKTSEELKALMPRLSFLKNLYGFTFNTIEGKTYRVESGMDLERWNNLREIKGTGNEAKFIDVRRIYFPQHFYRVVIED